MVDKSRYICSYISAYPCPFQSLPIYLCLAICLSVYQTIYPSLYLSIYLSINLSIILSIRLSINLSIDLPNIKNTLSAKKFNNYGNQKIHLNQRTVNWLNNPYSVIKYIHILTCATGRGAWGARPLLLITLWLRACL